MDHQEPNRRLLRLSCLIVFTIALAIRILFLMKIHGDAIRPNPDWELDSIAISVVEDGTFGNAYVIPTGPTAHLPPFPPLLLALIYKVFGITLLGGYVSWAIRILLQSAIWGLLPWIARRLGLDWRAGLVGGLGGALFPIWMGHGEAPAAVLLGLLVVALVRRWEDADGGAAPRPMASLLLGAGFGFSFHVQPAFLPVFLGYVAYEVWRRSESLRLPSTGLLALGALAICIPWGVRNYVALDAVLFVRSNFGLELHIGNHEGATANIDDPHYEYYGKPRDWSHPRIDVDDAIEVRDGGEVAYMRRKGRQAAGWIAANPGEFSRLTAERIGHFWLGPLGQPGQVLLFGLLTGLAVLGAVTALRGLPLARAALLIPLLTYPLVYYLVPWQHRYRFPIEWILYLLAGAAVWVFMQTAGDRLSVSDATS